MTPQEELNIKVTALQAAQGNLETAKPIFAWLAEPLVDAEVRRRVEQYINSLRTDRAP